MRSRLTILLVALGASLTATPAAAQVPSDAFSLEQWAVLPQTVFDLPGAWALAQGRGVTVAVVDSGMRIQHPDLKRNVWRNPREIPRNGIDDDGNGYVDDVHGVDLTSTEPRQNLGDGHGHGTHVAGTIAAVANGRGVVGVAYRAKLMTVKILDGNGAGTTGALAEGIRYAADNGANIINLSLESDADDPLVRAAVRHAEAANVLIVAAAGNGGRNLDSKPVFPVSIPAANVVGVAATTPPDGRGLPDFSNYGRLTIPVAAPGVEVLSTSHAGGYEHKSGTSMASPHVTGVAALMASVAPQLSAAELRALLLEHAVRASIPVGSGYVDALGSVLAATRTASQSVGQRPIARILFATRRGTGRKVRTRAQIALLGSRTGVRRLQVSLDGRRVKTLRGRRAVYRTLVRGRTGKRLRVRVLGAGGRRLASASARVRKVTPGKRGVNRGGRVEGSR